MREKGDQREIWNMAGGEWENKDAKLAEEKTKSEAEIPKIELAARYGAP